MTLDDAKTHLRIINDTDNDTALAVYLAAAFEYVQTETRQQFCTRTYVWTLDGFPGQHRHPLESDGYLGDWAGEVPHYRHHQRQIVLPLPPLQSVTSVTYLDGTGTVQTLDPSKYIVDVSTKPGRIVLQPGQSWPATNHAADCVNITFTAGYSSDGTNVPTILQQCILLMTGHFYENREGAIDRTITSIPLGVQCILDQQKFPVAHSA